MPKENLLGDKLKSIRETKNVTIEELSERSGIDVKIINSIENGDLIPSLSPLIKFSRSLGVRLGTLLDDQEDIGPVITRKGLYPKAVRFSDKKTSVASDLDFYSLAHGKAGRHMEPFLIDLFPSSADDTHTSTHEGEEFLYVFFGEVEVIYGKHTYHLKEGDSIYYDSIVEHNVHSLGDKPAKILAVVYAPF